jgi:hypothetical protein
MDPEYSLPFSPKPITVLCITFCAMLNFYCKELLASCSTPKLEDHPLSAVCDCLFNIFIVTLRIWRASPPSAT